MTRNPPFRASATAILALGLAAGCVGQMNDISGSNGPDPANGAAGKVGSGGRGGAPSVPSAGGSGAGSAPQTAGSTGSTGVAGASGSGGASSGPGGNGAAGTGGQAGTSSGGSPGIVADNGLPCDVQTMLSNRCLSCHGTTPIEAGLPSLVTRANLMAPSRTDPSKTNAALAVTRMQNAAAPMPPAPASRATSAEIATLNDWINAGYPTGSCGSGTTGAGGAGATGGAGNPGTGGATGTGGTSGATDPFGAAPICTSKMNWTGGNRGSAQMNPGMACISCHSSGEGPRFAVAGTLYPTAHEPDRCDGVDGTNGAQVIITGADGRMQTLTPNSAGNFYSQTTIKTPYQAKVVYMGRERAMVAMQTSGDCNSCHTQNGANSAPGRILLP